ncbi:MAG: hypothetical protein V1770_03225 [bacterium]
MEIPENLVVGRVINKGSDDLRLIYAFSRKGKNFFVFEIHVNEKLKETMGIEEDLPPEYCIMYDDSGGKLALHAGARRLKKKELLLNEVKNICGIPDRKGDMSDCDLVAQLSKIIAIE